MNSDVQTCFVFYCYIMFIQNRYPEPLYQLKLLLNSLKRYAKIKLNINVNTAVSSGENEKKKKVNVTNYVTIIIFLSADKIIEN